jgi:hypothetical protein
MRNRIRWIAAAVLAAVGIATLPAKAQAADISLGVTLGGPAYYYEPAPRHYSHTVVYEEPAYYYEERPRVVYERVWCPGHRVYHRGPRGHVHVHHRHHRHHHWDD